MPTDSDDPRARQIRRERIHGDRGQRHGGISLSLSLHIYYMLYTILYIYTICCILYYTYILYEPTAIEDSGDRRPTPSSAWCQGCLNPVPLGKLFVLECVLTCVIMRARTRLCMCCECACPTPPRQRSWCARETGAIAGPKRDCPPEALGGAAVGAGAIAQRQRVL